MVKVISSITLLLLLSFLPSKVFAHFENHEIRMTSDGFSPKELTISQGDTVVFVNDGEESYWPASDIHPTHQIFPQFDPKKGIDPGQSWSFKFTKVGTWQMHDHLFAKNTGKIVVEKNPEYAAKPKTKPSAKDKLLKQFERIRITLLKNYYTLFPSERENALEKINIQKISSNNDEQQIRLYLELFGSTEIMDKLISDSGGGSIVDCHQEAHRIGRIAHQIYGAEIFRNGNFDCHSGFIHGAMESFLQEKGTENLSENIERLCSTFKTSYGNFECLHGVGHGVMAFANYNLPEAIETCKQLTTSFEQSSCYGGVFMENIVTAEGKGGSGDHSTKWVNNDPHFPCNAVSSENNIQVQCYLMQTSRMLDIGNHDFNFVTKNCLSAPKDYVATCFQSEGRDAAGQTLRDPAKILNICSKVPKDNYSNCITGALNVIIEFWSDKMANKPHKLCKLVTDPQSKTDCYSLLASRLSGIYGSNKDKITQNCQYFESSYQSLCRKENNI